MLWLQGVLLLWVIINFFNTHKRRENINKQVDGQREGNKLKRNVNK